MSDHPTNPRPPRRTLLAGVLGVLGLLALVALPVALAGNPIHRGQVLSQAVAQDANVLSDSIKPTIPSAAYRLTIGVSGTASVVNVAITRGGTTVVLALNGGEELEAGKLYTFAFGAAQGFTYNFRCSTATTVAYLLVEEIQDGAL
ncbi:MAG: hypothetical protein KF878_00125 [Planctomycetes bacterium]|nr:hypothetical protein [Planctomycetota bacterium]